MGRFLGSETVVRSCRKCAARGSDIMAVLQLPASFVPVMRVKGERCRALHAVQRFMLIVSKIATMQVCIKNKDYFAFIWNNDLVLITLSHKVDTHCMTCVLEHYS